MAGAGSRTRVSAGLSRASVPDTLLAGLAVFGPILAQGVILRRPAMVALAERLEADRRAGQVLARLRDRYGPGPLRLRLPGRQLALVLAPADVRRVLAGSPEPFAVANREKRAALSHFQPHGVLVSTGRLRADRRRLNEAVLDTGRPMHRLAGPIAARIAEEARLLLPAAGPARELGWDGFSAVWWHIVRRVVLGDAARDDQELTSQLTALRADANWAYLRPRRHRLRRRFEARLQGHLDRAEPGSLAAVLAATPAGAATHAPGQVPEWLFAFDAAGTAAYRALALLAAHPAQAARARRELAADGDPSVPRELPYLRACVLESSRLWPTTPAVLRDTTTETTWDGGVLPPGTGLVIVSSFFHRDERALPYADRFEPEIWLDGRAQADWSLIPFSGGPGTCAGQDLVLFMVSTLLAAVLVGHDLRLRDPLRLDPDRPLPWTLNHVALRMAVSRAPAGLAT
jgi:cytochrome P450